MKKRILALVLVAVSLLTTVLTGCGSKDAGDDVITITMVESITSAERTAILREIADKYEAEHENIKIEIVSPPTESADAKITQMLMDGEKVDIVEVRDFTLTQFGTNGWLADIEKYIDNWDEKDTLTDSAKEVIYYYGDTAYLIPYGFYQRGIYYRQDWFKDAGLQAPTSWQEIYDAGVKLTNSDNSVYGYSFRGGQNGYIYADTVMWDYIGADKLDDGRAGYFLKDGNGATIFTLPEAKTALEFYKKMFKDICPADAVAWGFSEMVQGFVGGTTAMLIQDPEVIATCSAEMEDSEWALVPYPVGPSGDAVFPNGFAGWGMTSSCEHPDETADFLLYLSNAENNTYFAKNYSTIPIHSSAFENDSFFKEGAYAMYQTMLADSETYHHASAPQMYEAFSTYTTQVDTMYQKYLTDEISVDDMLNWLNDFWTEAYQNEGQLW